MQKFEGISFLWVLFMFGAIGVVFTLRAIWGYRQVDRDARSEYDYRAGENMIDPRLSRDGFIRAYKRFHNPRGAAHVAAGAWAILILTKPAMLLIQFILQKFWESTGQSRVFEPLFLVWQFTLFFSLLGVWAFIAYMTARHYHRYTPISLRDEILKELQD